jgi:hypothetical protein
VGKEKKKKKMVEIGERGKEQGRLNTRNRDSAEQ